MRSAFIVCYDIACDRRRTGVAAICEAFGERVQYSVFLCNIDRMTRVRLEAKLRETIHHDDDQVLIIDLGPADGRAKRCIRSLGRTVDGPSDGPIIV